MINNIQGYTDRVPPYVFPKHVAYEQIVLSEHASIIAGLRESTSVDAALEAQAGLFVGITKKHDADTFIKSKFNEYYTEEWKALENSNLLDHQLKNAAINRTWIRLINEALADFIKDYKVNGSKAKICVIDDVLPTGGLIKDAEDMEVEFTNNGE